ncbi:unnamed protein product [Darwinula stevensoni]|uniref:Peptidase S1 domain-containing protein n=1 Tax=Darwinula stevensoni TaxID=69355 RepID=A0A7R9A1K6_9CRUS|nr:unnamed protein product [Darwinula stevensoni]CAG0887923.1 unnamed protein product [Darwinula stevensoni]
MKVHRKLQSFGGTKMLKFVIAFISISFGSAASGGGDGWRVMGGAEAELGEFPWVTSIQWGSLGHWCGGAIYDGSHVITAAQCCLYRRPEELTVWAGVVDLENPAEGSTSPVTEIIVHEDFNLQELTNDICILVLGTQLQFGTNIGSIVLPQQGVEYQKGTPVQVSGWGLTREGDLPPTLLSTADIVTYTQDECEEFYGPTLPVYDHMICAGQDGGGRGFCDGDEGGPLVRSDGSKELVGIVSWSHGCARPSYHGVYTQVSYFVDWILSNVA